jgi:hypothetical protein
VVVKDLPCFFQCNREDDQNERIGFDFLPERIVRKGGEKGGTHENKGRCFKAI